MNGNAFTTSTDRTARTMERQLTRFSEKSYNQQIGCLASNRTLHDVPLRNQDLVRPLSLSANETLQFESAILKLANLEPRLLPYRFARQLVKILPTLISAAPSSTLFGQYVSMTFDVRARAWPVARATARGLQASS